MALEPATLSKATLPQTLQSQGAAAPQRWREGHGKNNSGCVL